MKKYFLVLRNTWDEMTTYRLNFVMWRIRTVMNLLTVYFLWVAVIPQQGSLFGYTSSLMLTYIILTPLFGALTLSTRTHEIGENINSGDLSTYLVRPFNYLLYWFSRDIGDKLMNLMFSISEVAILFFILKPPFFLQDNPIYLVFTIVALCFGLLINFFIGCLLGMFGFWSADVWAPRFIFYIVMTFFAGGIFPLDILPGPFFKISELLPFQYIMYFPIKVYLGQLSILQMTQGLGISFIWIILTFSFVRIVWLKGLRAYTAVGR